MTDKEALKQALEALEAGDWYINQLEMIVYSVDDDGTHENRAKVQKAVTAIKEALAQPEQEPRNIRERWNIEFDGDDLLVCFNDHEKSEGCRYERYVPATTTPPQRTWVVFPTMLRKMWSGSEVQAWLDENVNKEKNT